MKIDELEHFSVDELQKFTLKEIEQNPDILKNEIEKFGSEIPYNVYSKLCKVCEIADEELKKKNMKMIGKPKQTVKEVLDYILKLIQLCKYIPYLREKVEDFLWFIHNLLH